MQCLGKVVVAPVVVQRPVPDGPTVLVDNGWFCWLFASLAVFPSFVGGRWGRRPRRLMKIFVVFYVKVNQDPEVVSVRCGNLDIFSTSSIWQFLRQLQTLLEEFLLFFDVKVDSQRGSHMENWTLFFVSSLRTSDGGFQQK